MDTICGIGLPELIILILVSFVVIGPERSRDVALKTGRMMRTVVRSQWWTEFNDITQAIRDLPTTLVRLAEIEEAQADLQEVMNDIDDVGKELRRESRININMNDLMNPKTTSAASGSSPANTSEAITDPWGIANASAGTVFLDREESDSQDAEKPPPIAEEPPQQDET